MAKDRTSIPKKVREEVLGEYSYSCAICGRNNPQLHHIDEDPSNNEPMNLLPLCANHHLTDQHNPTRRIETGILQLFRKWKDPAILTPQFQSVYKRLRPLYDEDNSFQDLRTAVGDLTDFLSHLQNGEYFATKISQLVPQGVYFGSISLGPEPDHVRERRKKREKERRKEQNREHKEQLLSNREKIEELVMEAVKFQDWGLDDPDDAMRPKPD